MNRITAELYTTLDIVPLRGCSVAYLYWPLWHWSPDVLSWKLSIRSSESDRRQWASSRVRGGCWVFSETVL